MRAGPPAALKQSTQHGLAENRQYEWVETTTIRLEGEGNSEKQNGGDYGADRTIQLVTLG